MEIKKDLYYCGVLDKDLRVFDIIMYTDYGTTYNSYLLKGSKKTVLIETVKDKFFDKYVENIKSITDTAEIDYIVLNHTEPDHSGTAVKLYKQHCPNAKIVGTPTTIKFLKAISNDSFEYIEANEKTTIDLGGYTLSFFIVPFLHWPDSMYTYVKENKTLFTCDSFGCHYADDAIVNNKISHDFYDSYKYYYDAIIGPFKKFMRSALDKIKEIDIETICSGHGPVLCTDTEKYIKYYDEWSQDAPVINKVTIAYVSAYGYTEKMANEIARALKDNNIEYSLYDCVTADKSVVLEEIQNSKAILLGTPTILSDALPPIWEIVMSLNPIIHAKKTAGVFGSYGWSGEAVKNIEQRLKQLRYNCPVEPLKINFNPSSDELADCYSFGKKFAQAFMKL